MFYIRLVDSIEWHDDLVAMQKECLPGSPVSPPEEGEWWIAFDSQDRPVAFAQLKHSAALTDAGYLARGGVLKPHRGHGLQRRLIRVRERRARQHGWKWLRTDTTNNPHSANNLIACGFRMFLPEIPWSFKNACYWYKKIV